MASSPAPALVAEQFDTLEQQREASSLGMWIFLATETLLFGGLFFAYTVYRHAFPDAWRAASNQTDFVIGTINTAVLLCSSLTMALGVHAAQEGKRKRLIFLLLLTMLLGIVFMSLKGYEYYDDYRKHLVPGLNFPVTDLLSRHESMFFLIYFLTTGLHALHLTIGITLVGIMVVMAMLGRFSSEKYTPVELTGLYWHLVDIVWVFLYPLLYLVGRHT